MTFAPSFLRTLCFAAFASAVLACLPMMSKPAEAVSNRTSAAPAVPDVLVLALCGSGPTDQVSINYSSVVSIKQAMGDIKAMAKETGWFVGGERVTTMSVAAGGGGKSTSGSFTTLSILNYKEGLLPLQPFVNVLKRFRSIEVNFLTPERFRFHGLEDFENEFVKIHLIHSPSGGVGGGSYAYRVRVKDSSFDRITLPKRQPVSTPAKSKGLSGAARVVVTVAIAAACAAAAYLIVYALCGRRRSADGM